VSADRTPSRAQAVRVGQTLIELLNDPLNCGEHTVQIGASVGVALFPEDAREKESLCIAADLRMYDAKHDSLGDRDERHIRSAPSINRLEPQAPSGLQVAD
jgi:predicted signal transduction protein with EAL and GGDEF domain